MKVFEIITVLALAISYCVSAVNVECDFETTNWRFLGTIYICSVKYPVLIDTLEESIITSSNGTHNSGKSNDDVRGFYIEYKTIHYFPKGINEIFKNLNGISIRNSHLKKIAQEDLSKFPNLVRLNLYNNNIEVVEEDLFKFNLKLKYISLSHNKIGKIHPKVFDHLNQLTILDLGYNECINIDTSDVENIQILIQEVKSKCDPAAFLRW